MIFGLSVRDIARIGRVLLSVEGLSIIVMLIVLAVVIVRLAGGAHGNHLTLTVFSLPGGVSFHSLVLASVFGFTAFAGFEGAASLGEETANPRRSIPRALSIAIAAGVVFYVFCVRAVMAMGLGALTRARTARPSPRPPVRCSTCPHLLHHRDGAGPRTRRHGQRVLGGARVHPGWRPPDFRAGPRHQARFPAGRRGRNGPRLGITVVLAFAAAMVVIVRGGQRRLDHVVLPRHDRDAERWSAYAMVDLGAVRLWPGTPGDKAVMIVPLLGFAVLAYTMYNELYPRPPSRTTTTLHRGGLAGNRPGRGHRGARGSDADRPRAGQAEGMAGAADEDAPAPMSGGRRA